MKMALPSIGSLGLCVVLLAGCAEGPPKFTQTGFTGPTKKADLDDCWRRVNAANAESGTTTDGEPASEKPSGGGVLGLLGLDGNGSAKTPYELRDAHMECMRKRGYEVDGPDGQSGYRSDVRKPILNASR